MKRYWIRSILFNASFILLCAVLSIAYIPFIWLPRKQFVHLIRFYLRCTLFLERTILGLNYELRGLEHLPDKPPYIIAAKHQSTYETMKIHLLFDDPSIILKRELLRIPLWGIFLNKSGPIGIDRSNPETAIQSINEGARRVKEEGRPIVIFPQGTRVTVDQTAKEKPYKIGIARIQEATDLPIIPMATNTGLFWPRDTWKRSGGTVVFEFLPPIYPGMERGALLTELEHVIEPASDALAKEALEKDKQKQPARFLPKLIIVVMSIFILYTCIWGACAFAVKHYYKDASWLPDGVTRYGSSVHVSGFPFNMQIYVPYERFQTRYGYAEMADISIKAAPLPLPFLDVEISIREAGLYDRQWLSPISVRSMTAQGHYTLSDLIINDSHADFEGAVLHVMGIAEYAANPPQIDMTVSTQESEKLLNLLQDKGLINKRMNKLTAAGLNLYRTNEGIKLPVKTQGRTVYVGLVPVYTFASQSGYTPRKAYSPSSLPVSP